jgi:two-component system alkaline phosphatase synthesis response regulator PhoP
MSLNKKILLADDDEELLMTYRSFVEKAHFTVLIAHDGEEALKIAFEQRPDIAVLDVDMPKKDGLAVLQELRMDPWGRDLPIIILSGKAADDSRLQKMTEWAPTYYFVKGDQSLDAFMSMIRDIINGVSVSDR